MGDTLTPKAKMKVTIAVLCTAAATHALRMPSLPTTGKTSKIKAVAASSTEFAYGLPGALSPLGEWDPLNLLEGKSKEEVYRWREAELAHGRVAMIASLGFLVQEEFHPLFGGNIDGAAIDSIPEIPPVFWAILPIVIGMCETLRAQIGWASPSDPDNFMKLRPNYYPGDLKFDPLGLKPTDPAELLTMQNRELNHGRLAMFAAAGFLAQETVNHEPWLQNWHEMFG